MNRMLCLALALLLALGLAACGAPDAAGETVSAGTTAAESGASDIVVFADPVLEGKVHAAMGKREGDITAGDAALVLRLDLSNEWEDNVPADVKFSELSGIEYFINLKSLSICLNEVSDISALSGMTKLYSLELANNPVTDFSPIADIYPNIENKDFEMK